jgi:hypothetical protein|tara:strand:+ start:3305 stop:3520 length:216 start_codon:yes stop_codon:yes gene_type:complete
MTSICKRKFNHFGVNGVIRPTRIDVDKINFGQYGFKVNNSITLSVKSVLKPKYIQTILEENGEFIPLINER